MKSNYKMKCHPGKEPRIIVSDEFVEKNGLCINMESVFNIIKNSKFFMFDIDIALEFLPFEKVKLYLHPDYVEAIESGKQKHIHVIDVYEAAQDFLDYMVFAWMNAMDERGITASRSITKLAAWMKILGRDDVAEILESNELYDPYGRPALKKACEMLEIKYPNYL